MRNKIVTVTLGDELYVKAEHVFQYDYGLELVLDGIQLPAEYEVHFSNKKHGVAKKGEPSENGVKIPDEYLRTGQDVFAWVYLRNGDDDGYTVYSIQIPVVGRSVEQGDNISVVEHNIIDKAIEALNEAVEKTEENVRHYPIISDEHTWMLYDADAGEYVDTGIVAKGEDGFSPECQITEIQDGHRVVFTDINGSHSFDVMDGVIPGGAIPSTEKGAANGVAELDSSGKVPSSQLPSYVDDVLEFANVASFPAVGETGKIYVARNTNETYRWTGSSYVVIGSSLALGETSSTAYRGDRGRDAYEHAVLNKGNAFNIGLYKIETNTEGHVVSAEQVTSDDLQDLGLSNKADKADTILDTTLSRGRKANTNVGLASFAFGENVTASGTDSHAEGSNTQATGNYSHAEGYESDATAYASHAEGYSSYASGKYSHAEGYSSSAGGYYSHAEGYNTAASGNTAHTEGEQTRASGAAAHAEGSSSNASGSFSHAEGAGTYAGMARAHAEGYYTRASGENSHAEGNWTIAYGANSHAEGYKTSNKEQKTISGNNYPYGAFGASAHSEGSDTIAYGANSHAEGCETAALDSYAHAEGISTVSDGQASHAEGGATHAYGDYAHSEGSGSNAYSVGSHAEGIDTVANDRGAHAEGSGTVALGSYSHAEGSGTTASAANAHAEGGWTQATGAQAHAEGSGTTASAANAHAEGGGTTAGGAQAHAEGAGTQATATNSHAEGAGTIASGVQAHAEGYATQASGLQSHAEGSGTIAGGDMSHAEGWGTKATGNYSHASGKYNVEDSQNVYSTITGNGTGDANRSNAYALDWNGTGHFAGDVYVNCNNDSTGGTKLATLDDIPSSLPVATIEETRAIIDAYDEEEDDGMIVETEYYDEGQYEKGYKTIMDAADIAAAFKSGKSIIFHFPNTESLTNPAYIIPDSYAQLAYYADPNGENASYRQYTAPTYRITPEETFSDHEFDITLLMNGNMASVWPDGKLHFAFYID